MSSADDNVKPKMVIPDIPAFNKVRPKVVKVPKENVIRELCFELGKFKYNYVSDGINYVTYYNIYNKTKTYIYAEMVEQVYDGERRRLHALKLSRKRIYYWIFLRSPTRMTRS